MDSISELEQVTELMVGVDSISVFTKDLLTPPSGKLHDYMERIGDNDILTNLGGDIITKDEINTKLNSMETVVFYINGMKNTYVPANQNAIPPPLVNMFGTEMYLSIAYDIDQLKRAILIDKLDPEQLRIQYYEGKTVAGLKYPNKFDIFFRHNDKNLLYIIKGLSLLGYDHYNIHAGLVEVLLDDELGVHIGW